MLYIAFVCNFCRFFCSLIIKIFFTKKKKISVQNLREGGGWTCKDVFKRGSGGSKFSDFFLKSEGKEPERKKMRREEMGGGLIQLNC